MKLKNLLRIQCASCDEQTNVFKYAKSQIYCANCTTLLAKPTAHKVKILRGKLLKDNAGT